MVLSGTVATSSSARATWVHSTMLPTESSSVPSQSKMTRR
jgi:hypothetical protein